MNDELSKLIAEIEDVTKSVETSFGGLNGKQLNWKPTAKSWSIGQCLEHLIITNEKEFPAIEDALKENYKNPFWSNIPLLPKFFGSLLVYLFKPENKRKLKAPKSFQPSQSGVSEDIVADFAAHQQKFARLIEQSKRLNVRKTKIVSSVTGFITYNLFDSFLHLVVHERRHFNQAERVMQTQGFPH
jgi:hypothetical protein